MIELNDTSQHDILKIKFILLGAPESGKTAFIIRLM